VEIKDVIAFILLAIAAFGGIIVTCLSIRAREAAFFLMIAATVVSDRLDINFLSHFWYRGATRGIEISFVDILALSLLVSSFLFPRRGDARWRWPAGLGLMLLFFLYASASVLGSDPKIFGLFELSKMARGLIFFLAAAAFVRSDRELAILVLALSCAVCLEGVMSIRQRWLLKLDRVAGSLDHANSLSMYLCLTGSIFVAAIHSTLPRFVRRFAGVALAFAALSIVLTLSRAGIPIFALVTLGTAAMCASLRFTFKRLALAVVIAAGIAGLTAKFWGDIEERYTEATLSDEYLNQNLVESRGYYLRVARVIIEDRFFGVGLNNWSYWVSKRYGAELNTPYSNYDDIPPGLANTDDNNMNFAAPAHNLTALTVGELGVPGALLFLLLWLRWFQLGFPFLWKRNPAPARQIAVGIFFAVLGVFLQSITEWTFRQTPIYLTFHAFLGVLARLHAARRQTKRAATSAAGSKRRSPARPLPTAPARSEPVHH
jgi:O-antigen ligase/polysaccharide polymerase Wzy-like membrane protein